eukprot:4988501-Pleurochrysis_carterae.AAC.4
MRIVPLSEAWRRSAYCRIASLRSAPSRLAPACERRTYTHAHTRAEARVEARKNGKIERVR